MTGAPAPRRLRRIRLATALLAVASFTVAGCAAGQDPGVDPGVDRPANTSDTLGRCPAGGPDATTPPAGCLGPAGSVLRP